MRVSRELIAIRLPFDVEVKILVTIRPTSNLTELHMFMKRILILMTSLCISLFMNACTSSANTNNASNQIYCIHSDEHPICKATYKLDPSATLGSNGISSGVVVMDGKEVEFVCQAGTASMRRPRSCTWSSKPH